jgi:hypothetical protein
MDLRDRLENLERHVIWTIRDNATFEDVLQSCNLKTDRDLYREIDRDTACQYLTRIFFADLAYSCPEMSFEEASQLANHFLAEFALDGSRYYSNGTASLTSPGGLVQLRGWNQVGKATFDWGVLVVGIARSGCVWAEDED